MFGLIFNRKKILADAKRLGRWGEQRCEKFLKQKGFKILTRNFSCRMGEIDLVAADYDGSIVFAEVKTRANESFAPTESVVTPAKVHRMHLAARQYISAHNLHDRPCRFDIIAVTLPPKGEPQIRHYPNAFVP